MRSPLPRRSCLRLSMALLLAGVCAASGVAADAGMPAGSLSLRKIREAGVITIGYREAAVPFSYLDARQQPIGYSMDICRHIVAAVKRHLQLRDLEIKFVPVTTATRIPLVANETVDLECGVTTNNAERQQQVAFTVTTFVAASRLVSKRAAGITRLSDLRGKTVVSTVGTTSIKYLTELNALHRLDVKILAAKDDLEAFRMVENDRVAAYAMDDVLLHASIANARRPEDFAVSPDTLSVEPYGVMLARGDAELKKIADDAITVLFRSGEIHRLYRRWFQSPLPPKGINLNMPMSPALAKAIARPSDSGDPASYR
jgi:glutamate/aspartate transport system substrate-binding protein